MNMPAVLAPHIESVRGICGGKPKVAGKRFTVQHIYVLHERLRMSAEEIVDQYDLTLAEVFAALAYAFDHQKEMEKAIRRDDEAVREFKRKNPSNLRERQREHKGQILPR